jgi:hypothetical protein
VKSASELTHLTILIEIGAQDLPVQDTLIDAYRVKAYYQGTAKVWMVDADRPDFLLLSSEVLDALLAEAHTKGYPVRYVNREGIPVRV